MQQARAALVLLAGIAACGPIPVEHAERECFERARLAAGPRGAVAVGTGTGGTRAGLSLSISSDYVQGRDPSAVYDACVLQRSGQPPRQPLYTRSDWTG
ncbi:MAG: hypothetical protein KDE03_08485 [Rhodobacteraceae bacterium]|nr:hypothetical protein [Paracoccaceae bacterium]